MTPTNKAKKLARELDSDQVKFGDIKKLGKDIKKDHGLALELWATGGYHSRLLSVLIMDKKLLDEELVNRIAADISEHQDKECEQLADWFLANQLTKDKKTISLLESSETSASPILRRLFWYYQARLRWTGQKPPGNSEQLIASLEKNLAKEEPLVQWAMNFCAGQIGVHEPKFRTRCVKLGKAVGLYKDEVVAKNCTPSYLPEFIRIEVDKRKK